MDIRTFRGAIAANNMFYVLFVSIYYQVYSMHSVCSYVSILYELNVVLS